MTAVVPINHDIDCQRNVEKGQGSCENNKARKELFQGRSQMKYETKRA